MAPLIPLLFAPLALTVGALGSDPSGFDPALSLLTEARTALAAGELGIACVRLREGLALAPGEPELRYLLARTLNDRGLGAEAVALFESPRQPSAWMEVERGRALQMSGDVAAAERAFRGALSRYPACGSARLELANLLLDGGELLEAREIIDALASDAPGEPAVAVLSARGFEAAGDPVAALRVLEAALGRESRSSPLRLSLARLLLQCDRSDEAWMTVEPLLDGAPDASTLLQVARVAQRTDRMVDALSILGAALVIDPTAPDVLREMLELVEGGHGLVERLARRRIDADPADTYGWGELLEQHLSAGRCAEVLSCLNGAPEEVREDFEVRRHEASALRRLGRTAEARVILESLTQELAVELEVWYELGLLEYAAGNHERAAKAFDHAAKAEFTADARYNQALALRHLERHASAAVALEAALVARPAFLAAWLELGRECRFRLGDAPRARRAFERYLELGGDDVEVRRWMEQAP